ncbi:MAG TPA: DUF2065 domain-containing protein [Candidatus Polarisedimenticolaceae bacterium]|nr:DUF2065 domain-containing protein [Candidatus Polarisedimenticolaceae bacterium]
MSSWTLFLAGIGLAMLIEGTPYFVAPRAMRRLLRAMEGMSDGMMRAAGFTLIVCGLLVTYVATR